jgi:hypothetical protein
MLPIMGVNSAREIANPANITPSQIPVAPILSAYRGRSGAIIPAPSMEEKMEMARIGKIFFIMRDCYLRSILLYK